MIFFLNIIIKKLFIIKLKNLVNIIIPCIYKSFRLLDIDPTLNEKGYIVPGLGDAGDLSYGIKL